MKNKVLLILIGLFASLTTFTQNGDLDGGMEYLKRIEYNEGGNNLKSKGDMEKQLLWKQNAPVEFFFYPFSHQKPENPGGFRITRDSLSEKYILEALSFFIMPPKNFTIS